MLWILSVSRREGGREGGREGRMDGEVQRKEMC